MLVPVRASPVPSVVRGSALGKFFLQMAEVSERQLRATGVRVLRRCPLAHGELVVSAGSVLDFGGGTDWPSSSIAIVNAANCGAAPPQTVSSHPPSTGRLSAGDPLSGGLGGGGVDGAITSAGGAALAADRRALPILPGTRLASPRCSHHPSQLLLAA